MTALTVVVTVLAALLSLAAAWVKCRRIAVSRRRSA